MSDEDQARMDRFFETVSYDHTGDWRESAEAAADPDDDADSTETQDSITLPSAAGILYLAGQRALFIKRAGGENVGTWAFPAGKIEPGETPIQAAIRESVEETGHAPESGLTQLSEGDGFTLFVCSDPEFAPVLNEEHDGYCWSTFEAMPQPLHPGVEEAVQTALRAAEAQAQAAMDESNRLVDTNGWFEVKNNPLSKVGVFTYGGAQLRDAPDPSRTYQVYRPAEELSDPKCIASFRLIPWINDHKMLGPEEMDLTPAEKKGVQGVIGEEVYFEGDTLYGNIKVFSQSLASLIEAGKRELSCGYRCKYDWTPGVFDGQPYDCVQRVIRGNHLALVNSGRMGPDVAVLDESHLDQVSLTTDAKEPPMADEVQAGGSGMTLEQAIEAIKGLMPAIKMLQDAAAGKTAAVDDPDMGNTTDPDADTQMVDADTTTTTAAVIADPDKTKQAPTGGGMDAKDTFKAVMRQISRRDALAKQVSIHVGTFDHSEMTEEEVAVYGAAKLGIKAPKGMEAAALAGFLQAAVDPRKQAVSVAMDSRAKGGDFMTRHLASIKE